MKKLIMPVFVFLCASFLYAQSSTGNFIDSPSWVLNRGGEQSSQQAPQQTRPQASQPAAQKAKDEPQPSVMQSPASGESGKKKGAGVKEEGFFHPGLYLAPTINWVGSVKGIGDRDGVSACFTPSVILDMRVFRRFFIGVGVSFNTVGGAIKYEDVNSAPFTRHMNFSYLEIPVRFKLKTPDFIGGTGSFFISAGVHPGFGLIKHYRDIYRDCTVQIRPGAGQHNGTFIEVGRLDNNVKLMNLSVTGQAGYNFRLAKHMHFNIAAQYLYGTIQPVKDFSFNALADNTEFHCHQVCLIFGVTF